MLLRTVILVRFVATKSWENILFWSEKFKGGTLLCWKFFGLLILWNVESKILMAKGFAQWILSRIRDKIGKRGTMETNKILLTIHAVGLASACRIKSFWLNRKVKFSKNSSDEWKLPLSCPIWPLLNHFTIFLEITVRNCW